MQPDEPDYDVGDDLPEPGWPVEPVLYVRSSSGVTAAQIAEAKGRFTEKKIERRTGRKLPADWPRDSLGDDEC